MGRKLRFSQSEFNVILILNDTKETLIRRQKWFVLGNIYLSLSMLWGGSGSGLFDKMWMNDFERDSFIIQINLKKYWEGEES